MGKKLATKFVQLGNKEDERTGAVSPPIFLSTAYQHDYLGHSTGYDYTRTINPTREILEKGFADLESGDKAFACSSGMAAIQLVLSLFKSGDEILLEEDIYGGTYRLLAQFEKSYEIKPIYANFADLDSVHAKITDRTRALFIETPTNPLMKEIDIQQIAEFAKENDLLLIVDNTFLTPYHQRPLELGANIVIHSATKYLGGHNDVLAGLVVAKGKEICEKLSFLQNAIGTVLAPFDCWLLIRGIKTLHLRMERHGQNAKAIVQYLQEEPLVTDILYPGKGGMISFRIQTKEMVDPFLSNLQLISFAESLGGVESFITYPPTQTHGDIPAEERKRRGICDRLLRFSVGLEDIDDLIEDLKHVFAILRTNFSGGDGKSE